MSAEKITPLRGPSDGPSGLPAVATLVNDAAEQALLGALFVDNRAYDRVVDFLRPTDFATAVHARIYEAIAKFVDRNETANPVTLKAFFDRDGALAEIGGAQYLARLAAAAVTTINAEDYGRHVLDLARRRAIIVACQEAWVDAGKINMDRSAADILSDFDRSLLEIVANPSGSQAVGMDAAVDRAIAVAEKVYQANGAVVGITTGLTDLDGRLGGLHDSDLVVVAGRPGQGKSALAMCIAEAAAMSGKTAMVFSLEMSADQLAARQIAGRSGVSAEKQRSGPISREEMRAITETRHELATLPLIIDDDVMVTVSQMRARARKQRRRRGLDLIVIDYLQLMLSDKTRPENRVQEVSAISRGLKSLAKEMNVPVIALAQLNRQVEARDDKRPVLSDLRDSGSIEQDADVVMFVFREEEYVSRAEPRRSACKDDEQYNDLYDAWTRRMAACRGIAEILIRKNRHGATRSIKTHFNAELTRFENLAWTP